SPYWIAVECAVCSPGLPWADPRAVPIYRAARVNLEYRRAATRSALCHRGRAGRDQFLDPPPCEPALAQATPARPHLKTLRALSLINDSGGTAVPQHFKAGAYGRCVEHPNAMV